MNRVGGRYTIRAPLGSGGTSDVFHAWDEQRSEDVALKLLRHTSPEAIARFKEEFRAVALLSHPNLVALHELERDEATGNWFFTMELVHGLHLVEFFRQERNRTHSDTLLRSVLGQLARGIQALHDAGKLHRDIKPTNVRVTPDGRAILLDFGLIVDAERASTDEVASGTAAYVAPEQAMGGPISTAADWYAFGVVLYEILTGAVPFTGQTWQEIIRQKRTTDPARPRGPGIADDLAELATTLLRRNPDERPKGPEILSRLEPNVASRPLVLNGGHGRSAQSSSTVRRDERSQLDRTREALSAGKPAVACIRGRSGIGKSYLARQFLNELQLTHSAVILDGRSYERDSSPYKSIDPLMDRLAAHLAEWSYLDVEDILPPNIHCVTEIFPVLQRVEAIEQAPRQPTSPDPRQRRQDAFAAMRTMLDHLARKNPLVLCIDDAQWGDADSAAFIEDLFDPPSPPPLLLLMCTRDDQSPLLDALNHVAAAGHAESVFIDLEPLDANSSRQLAMDLLATHGVESVELGEQIAREAEGNPLFIDQLVERSASPTVRPTDDIARTESLDQVLADRIMALPKDAQQLLEVLAIAARPLTESIASTAMNLPQTSRRPLLALQAARLVLTRDRGPSVVLETFHDRVRAAARARMSATDVRGRHLSIAQALESHGGAESQILFEHWLGAGDKQRAGKHARDAADQARQMLAFDRAAQMYATVIDLQLPDIDTIDTHARLGEALANAGRGAESAKAYQVAARQLAQSAPRDPRQLAYRREASEQLLRSGHFEEGMSELRAVLSSIGLRHSNSVFRTLLSIAFLRLRLSSVQLENVQPRADRINDETLAKVDTCWSAALGLSLVDPLLASHFQLQHLHLALRVGDSARIARGLDAEASVLASMGGTKGRAQSVRLLDRAETLATNAGNPYARAFTMFSRGSSAYLSARWRDARKLCDEAEKQFRASCTGAGWEIVNCRAFSLSALAHMGHLRQLAEELPHVLRDSDARSDVYASTGLRMGVPTLARLAANDPSGLLADAQSAISRWPNDRFLSQHYLHLVASTNAELYAGDSLAAWNRVRAAWPALKRAFFLRLQCMRVELEGFRARTGLALAATATVPVAPLLKEASQLAKRIATDDLVWSAPLAALIEAGVSRLKDQHDEATVKLREAATGFDTAAMDLHAAVSRFYLGQLLGTKDGDEIRQKARHWMTDQGIQRPERMAAMIAPGLAGRTPELNTH